MYRSLDDAIKDIWGQDVTVKEKRSVSGGDVNDSYHLFLSNGDDAFLKINHSTFPT